MEVFEFALEAEKVAQDFFSRLARHSGTIGVRNVCSLLAVEQQEIVEALLAMRKEYVFLDTDSGVLDEAAEQIHVIFSNNYPIRLKNDLEAYFIALRVEREILALFQEMAEKEFNRNRKSLLKERQHSDPLENMCDFVAAPHEDTDGSGNVRRFGSIRAGARS